LVKKEKRKFHDIVWDSGDGGETGVWLGGLYKIAGLGTLLGGDGRTPPPLSKELIWALENLHKYPIPGDDDKDSQKEEQNGWVVVESRGGKDLLHFI